MNDTPKCCLTCMFDHYDCSASNRQACGRVKAHQKTFQMDMSGAERRVMNWIKDLNADDDAILLRAAEILRRRISKKDNWMAGARHKRPGLQFLYGEPPKYSHEDLEKKYREAFERPDEWAEKYCKDVPPGGEALKHDMANHFFNHKKREWLKTDSGKAWLDKKGVTLREDPNPFQDWIVEDSEIKKVGI